jgi:hypothetical protein
MDRAGKYLDRLQELRSYIQDVVRLPVELEFVVDPFGKYADIRVYDISRPYKPLCGRISVSNPDFDIQRVADMIHEMFFSEYMLSFYV